MRIENTIMKKMILGLAMMAAVPAIGQAQTTDKVAASFPGGEKALTEYIESNRRYPQTAKDNGIEGIVEVRFLVKSDGKLEQLSIVRLVDPDLETEAIRLVKEMPAWEPAKVGDKAVDSEESVKVSFVL